MAKDERIYQRLTRPKVGLASYSSLWLGPDHLMLVKSTGYTEEYLRYNFSDIQAFMLGPSSRRMFWNLGWGALAFTFGILVLNGLLRHSTPIASSIGLVIVAVFFLINYLLGPSCSVFLVTRVQTVWLPIVRRGKFDRIVQRVQPLIEAAQADLQPAPEAQPTTPPIAP